MTIIAILRLVVDPIDPVHSDDLVATMKYSAVLLSLVGSAAAFAPAANPKVSNLKSWIPYALFSALNLLSLFRLRLLLFAWTLLTFQEAHCLSRTLIL
jgi:hypothetical protein